MKIGVLSDTHILDLATGHELAARLLSGPFAEVEAILHAGDVVIPDLESCFYPLPWYGVRGNMDSHIVGLPESRVLHLAGKSIGMIHGWGAATGIEQRVATAFAGQNLDVLVFGHSHQPLCCKTGSVLLFNPGSATDRRSAEKHTAGILTLGATVTGEIIPID